MRDRAEEVQEDLLRRRLDMARAFGLTDEVLDAFGRWVASLAPWTHFVTLTHDPRRLGKGHTIVGRQRHRRQLSRWLHDDVRRLDPSARWWSEMELHKSGQSHEHGLLAAAERAPVLSMRQRWYERAGYAKVIEIAQGDVAAIAQAIYVAKYTGKAAAVEPFIVGFGLHRRPSHSLTFAAAVNT